MGKHKTIGFFAEVDLRSTPKNWNGERVRVEFCVCCGRILTDFTSQECPFVGGETTETKRACETGEVKELKMIQEYLLRCKDTHYSKPWDSVKYREEALVLLQELIQKHEGLDGK